MLTSTPAMKTEKLCLSREGQLLLRNVDFEIETGECVAITGNNGAGKTTFLKCLAALIRPTSGKIWWFGQPISARHTDRQKIGMVAHESHLYDQLTVRENLLFAARMHSVADAARAVDRWLESVDLSSVASRQVRAVSRGMRRRLALCRAMVHNPKILLLDEPFSGLDRGAQDWLAEQLRTLRSRGTSVCMVIHDPQLARRVADRTLLLECGTFQLSQLQRKAAVRQTYDRQMATCKGE